MSKEKKVLFHYVTRDFYEVGYDPELFKFGALLYVDFCGYVGVDHGPDEWRVEIISPTSIAVRNPKESPIILYPSKEKDTMLILEWAYEILDPKPELKKEEIHRVFIKEEVDG